MRDRLRGVTPRDYDVATSARPEQVEALFTKTVAVGAAFGVIVVVRDDVHVEVATFREDVGVGDGRHPESVRFADARADALRRDFTINGMFLDPETDEVLDFVGGRKDLDAKVIRTIGQQNIEACERVLGEIGIPIVGSQCGGEKGRRVTFDSATGLVTIEIVGENPIELHDVPRCGRLPHGQTRTHR